MEEPPPIPVDLISLPDASLSTVDFRETTFFQNAPDAQLPPPSIVRQKFVEKRSRPFTKHSTNDFIVFENLGLIVKSGERVRVEEALTLRMMNLLLPDDVPTPEVFGWRLFEGMVFVYMSFVPGTTLNAVFSSLDKDEKTTIAKQLSQMILALRRLRQGTEGLFLGSLIRSSLIDYYWRDDGGAGPFNSVEEFNNEMQEDAIPRLPVAQRNFDDPYRKLLSDSAPIVFTHADVNTHNIMIDGPPGSRRIVSLFDWEQAGWYPDYWEYCKMKGIEHLEHGWVTEGWIDKVMKPYENEILAWGTYMLWRAP